MNDTKHPLGSPAPQVDWLSVARELLGSDPDVAIDFIMAELARCHDADRAWMIRYNKELTHFWNTHEWTRGQVSSHVNELQGIPVAMTVWLHDFMLKGKPVAIRDVNAMPRAARRLRREFLRQQIKSLVCVPILWKGHLAFQIGFDQLRDHRDWDAQAIADLQNAGDLIALHLLHPVREDSATFPPHSPVEPRIHLGTPDRANAISREEILWIQAQGNYTIVHLRDGRQVFELKSLRTWELQLPAEHFARLHRQALVSVAGIESLDRRRGEWKIRLKGVDEAIPVGRAYRPALRHHINI